MAEVERVPAAVRGARTWWFVAIGAGVFETILVTVSGHAGDGAIVGVSIRVVIFGAAFVVVLRMVSGRRWARLVLASALGVLGTLSMTVDPFLWLIHGNSLTDVIRQSGPVDLLFGASRVVHVAAVLAACVYMFVPSANEYFRTAAPPASHEIVGRRSVSQRDAAVHR